MSALFQIYDDLDPATEAALRSSIRRWGVIYPIVVDQHGHVIDGHHRQRIAHELGLKPKTEVRRVRNEDEARELARTLNEDRRQLDPAHRRPIVADLRREGHSERAIAGALGVGKTTVRRDISKVVQGDHLTGGQPATAEASENPEESPPARVVGRDGKSYPAARSTPSAGDQLGEVMTQAIENEPAVARSFAQTDLHRALSAVVKLRANYQDPAAAADLVPDDEREEEALAADDAIAWFETFRRRLRQSHLRVVTGSGR